MNDKIPYTEEMLSTIFRRDLNTVRLALKTFEKYGMVELVKDVITIPNWSKHQSLDQLEQKKEYQKEYMRGYREKQKLLAESGECKSNCNTNSKSNVSFLDKNKSKSREELEKKEKDKVQKHKYGSYEHVLLTQEEYDKLFSEFGSKAEAAITFLDEYIEMKGYKAKNHNLAIRKWVLKAVDEQKRKDSRTDNPYKQRSQDYLDAWRDA